ncbi:YadA-like family protein [Acinetobacter ursingii]|nr:YadA-like family protein [Acinetobacter ursingii]MDH2103845.1 YadA-like family protein [Acinetobacter ursingii]
MGDQLKVTGGASGTLTEGNIGVVANGSDTLQLKLAKDVNLTNAGSLTVGTTKLTDGKVEIKDASNNSNVSTSTNTVMTAGASSNTIDANSITLKNAANNVVLSGSTGTLTGLTNKTLTVSGFATQGRAATEEQLKLVNDTANKGWNITTNKDTANKSNVAPDATVDFSNSDKNITVSHSGTNVDLKLAEVVNIGGQSGGATISVNGKNGTITGLTNKTFDPNNYTTGRAATEDQLATPLTFTGDNAGVNVQRKLGQQLSIVGGESVATNLTDNNIGVVADSTNNKLTVKLSKDIKLNSVNAAGTVIDSKGLTFVNSSGGAIPNSPSISATGINAGTNKITNVGAGAITDTSMDAVNGSQIKGIIDKGFTVSSNGNTAAKDTIALGENVDFSATDTNIKVTNTGNNQITFGLEPVVKVGPATGGSPVTINGNTGQITGLTNKTTTSSDFATVGRAATEEQLKTIQTGLTDSGFGLKAADSNTVNKKLGETIDIVGADSNITTKVVNGQVAVELSKNIDLSKAGSLTVGNTKVTDGKIELKDGAKSNSSTVDGTVVSDGTNTTTVGASQITVGAGSNPIIINGATGRVSGLTNTTWDPNATYNQKQAATEEQLKSVSDVAQNANKGWKFTSTNKGGVASAAQKIAPDDTLDFNNTDGNIKLAATANNLTVNLNPDVNLTSAGSLTVGSSSIKNNEVKVGSNTLTDNGLTVGSTSVTSGNVTGLTNKTTTSSDFATVGRAATEEQLKTIQTGLTDSGFGLKAADSNTVNKKLGETIDIVGADSNITTKVVNGQVAVELSKNIDLSKTGSLTVGNSKVTDGKVELKDGAKSNSSTVDGTVVSDGTNTTTVGASQITVGAGSNPVIINGATGRVSGLTNTTWDPNATYNQKQAATEEQLKSVSDVAQNANKGWKFTSTNKGGVASAAQKIAPDDTLDFNNTDGNIKLAATANNLTVNLNPDVNLTSAGSLTVGSSSIKNNEVKVGSNTLTDNGLTVGSTSVTSGNVTGLTNKTTTGSDFATVGRAATEEQLKTIQTGLTDSGFGLKAADSNTVNKKLGETIDIVGADSNITTKVVNGQVAVELSKNIDLSKAGSLTVGNTKVTDGKIELKDGAKSNSSTVDGTVVSDGTNTTTVGASQITVGAGSNPVIINGATGRVSGLTNTTWDPNATYNQKQAATEEQLKSVSDVAQNANKGWKFTSTNKGGVASAAQKIAPDDTLDFNNTDGNIKLAATANNLTVNLNPDVNLTSAGSLTVGSSSIKNNEVKVGSNTLTDNGLTVGSTNVTSGNVTGLTNKTTTGSDFATVGRAATEEQLKTIQTGLTDSGFGLKAADSNTVNKKLGETIDIVGADSNITTKVVNGQVAVELSKNIDLSKAGSLTVGNTKVTDGKIELKDGAKSNSSTVDGTVVSDGTNTTTVGASQITVGAGSNPVIINGATGRVSGLTNTTWDPNATYNQKQAATEEQLKSVSDVAQNANKGWKFTSTNKGGVASAAQKIAPDDTLDFNNTDGNIKLAATANNLTVNLNPDVNLTSAGSLTVGSSSIKNNEVKVGSNTLTDNGLTVGSTSVTSGNVTGLTNKTTTSSDFATVGRAATEEQLKTIQTGLTDSGFGLKAADSNTVNKKLGETIDIVGADSNITTKVVNGQVAVELSKNIDLSKAGSLTVGNTKVTDGKIELKDGAKSNSSTVDGTTVTDGTNSSTIGAGSISVSNGTNQTLIGATQVVVGGASPVTLNGATGRVSGLTNTAWDPNATYNQKQAATEEQLKSVSDVAQNANKGWNVKSDSTLASTQVKPEDTVDIGLANDEKNLKVAAINSNGTTTIDFSLSKDLLLDSVNAGGTVIDKGGLRFVDPITGLPLSNTPSISLGGINAGNQIISNVAPGKNGTDAVNVNQLNDVKAIAEEGWVFTTATSGKGQTVNSSLQTIKPNQRFTMISGDNVELIQNGDKVTITTTPEVNFDKVTVGNVVIDKTTNKITGVEAGTVAANSKDVVNGSQLHDLGSGVQNIIGGNTTYDPNTGTYTNNNIGDTGQNNINDAIKSINDTAQNANKGWTVSTNGQNASQVKPTDTVDFANKDGNIKVNNTGNNITVDLAKDIQVDSVTAGDTTVNNNGLTINGGPSVTKNGIDAAGNKVTGVAEGSIAQGSKDAVNGSQIHDIIGDGAFQGGDGNTITNIGGTGATNINDAIGSINQKAGQHSTVEAGQNITVKESTNSNGGKEYTVATADDVKFNSVTSNTVTANNVKVGDVNIDQNGINAGNHKITNVAPGEISSTSKDAVNGSQLNTSNQYIVNSLGGGAKYENGQFTGPTYNVNNGSYNNVGDALGALNQADINLGNRITNLGDRLEQVFYNVNGRIDDVEKKANAGIASAMALEGAPFVAGKFTYAVGAAYHGGENAVGATLRKTADNGRWSITGGVAAASQGDPSVRVGISGVID